MKPSTARALLWFAVPPPEMYGRWGARRYHFRVATGILGQLIAVLAFWSAVSLTPLLFTDMSWKLFGLLWVPCWIVGARHMNAHVLDRLRLGFSVGLEDTARVRIYNLVLFPVFFIRVAFTYLISAAL